MPNTTQYTRYRDPSCGTRGFVPEGACFTKELRFYPTVENAAGENEFSRVGSQLLAPWRGSKDTFFPLMIVRTNRAHPWPHLSLHLYPRFSLKNNRRAGTSHVRHLHALLNTASVNYVLKRLIVDNVIWLGEKGRISLVRSTCLPPSYLFKRDQRLCLRAKQPNEKWARRNWLLERNSGKAKSFMRRKTYVKETKKCS